MPVTNYRTPPPGSNTPIPTKPSTSTSSPTTTSAGMPEDLEKLLINYNDKFANADPALFRDQVIAQLMGVLIGTLKPNALLVGAAGVGKTRIVEDLARRIVTKDATVPPRISTSTIYELPLANIVAGSSLVGALEEKLQMVIDYFSDPANDAILFIDEMHQVMSGAGTYEKIAEILKPALARGDMRVIGSTTTQEAQDLMNNPAFSRRFSRVIVDELTQEQSIEILHRFTTKITRHYGPFMTIQDDLLPVVAQLADQYHTVGSHRPDTALTLLDRTCGEAIVERKAKEEALKDDPILLAALQQNPSIRITENMVKRTAVKLMTGHASRENLDFDALNVALHAVKGQNQVIEHIIKQLTILDRGLFPTKTPTTFLFAGKSGVGKTEIAKILAQELTHSQPIILNMTEYHSSASINRIIGSPAGYVGSTSNAELPFDILETNPYQVILLDEFEKADKSVQRLFMSAFDEGFIKTARGKTVDFSKAIIIATTNASHTNGARNPIGFSANEQTEAEKAAADITALKDSFDIELLNRFTKILTFNAISADVYKDILAVIYRTEIARIKDIDRRITLPDEMSESDLDMLATNTFNKEFGARPAKKAVREYIEANI